MQGEWGCDMGMHSKMNGGTHCRRYFEKVHLTFATCKTAEGYRQGVKLLFELVEKLYIYCLASNAATKLLRHSISQPLTPGRRLRPGSGRMRPPQHVRPYPRPPHPPVR